MKRTVVSTPNAPAAIGPYSQAIQAGNFVFASGQLGLDPQTGNLVEGVEAQAQQALVNLSAVLLAAGSSMDQIVKVTLFLVNLADFATVNAIYAKHFTVTPPARSTIQVAALPKGGLVEFEAVALC